MSLQDQIQQDMKAAMKAKNNATLSTLRLLHSSLQNKRIETGEELREEDVQRVIKKEVKKLKDSLASFEKAGRKEKVANLKQEIALLEEYLPEQMSDEQLKTLVEGVVEDVGAESMNDMGKVMGAAMRQVEGRADGNRVKEIVLSVLKGFVFIVTASLLVVEPVHAAAPIFPGTTNRQLFEYALRIGRVVFMVAGVVSVNLILKGGFTYMVGASRHEAKTSAVRNVTSGVFGTVVIMFLFTWATVALQEIA